MSIEHDVIAEARRTWVSHRRHPEGAAPPSDSDIGLNLHWGGSSWYACVAALPARTPGRFVGEYAKGPTEALARLLGTLRRG